MFQTLHSATRGESARYKENVGFCVGFAEFFVRHVLCIWILLRQQVTDNGRKTTNNGSLPFSSLISQKNRVRNADKQGEFVNLPKFYTALALISPPLHRRDGSISPPLPLS